MNKEEHSKLMLEKITEIEDLKSELKKKNKIIRRMAEHISTIKNYNVSPELLVNVDDIIKEYERKVEYENN